MVVKNLVLNAHQLSTSRVSALIETHIQESLVVNFSHMAMRTAIGMPSRISVVLCDCCTIAMLVKFAICCAVYTCVGITQRQHI